MAGPTATIMCPQAVVMSQYVPAAGEPVPLADTDDVKLTSEFIRLRLPPNESALLQKKE